MPTERGGFTAGNETTLSAGKEPCASLLSGAAEGRLPEGSVRTAVVSHGCVTGLRHRLLDSRYGVIANAQRYEGLQTPGGAGSVALLLISSEALHEAADSVRSDQEARGGGLKIVALIDCLGAQEVSSAFKPWVDGYVATTAPREVLLAYLDLVMMGQKFIAGETLAIVKASIRLIDARIEAARADCSLSPLDLTRKRDLTPACSEAFVAG